LNGGSSSLNQSLASENIFGSGTAVTLGSQISDSNLSSITDGTAGNVFESDLSINGNEY
jgi:hypothetical protein